MKILIKILVITFTFMTLSHSQTAPDTLWTKTYGGSGYEWGNSVQQTYDNGYIITGTTESYGSGSTDIWLIRTDSFGDTVWTRTFDGGYYQENGNCVQQTSDSGFIIVGEMGAPNTGIWLIKTNSKGNTLWSKTYGGIDTYRGNFVQQTSDSGYVIVGSKQSFGQNNWDLLLIKTDDIGNTVWTKTYGQPPNLHEFGNAVQQTSDGGYIITGEFGHDKLWLLKTDDNGDTLWTKIYTGSDIDDRARGNSVQQTRDGGYIIAGSMLLWDPGGGGIWLIKTDASGDSIWSKIFVGNHSLIEGRSVVQTADDGYMIAGYNTTTEHVCIWLIKTNVNGDSIWTLTPDVNRRSISEQVIQTSDGGYVVVGGTENDADSTNIWLVKIAPEITDIDDTSLMNRTSFELLQNYPNPCNPSTKITFTLPKSEYVTLNVFNTLGQKVATLLDRKINAGTHDVQFDASELPSGIYFYRIQVGDAPVRSDEFSQVRKMILIR